MGNTAETGHQEDNLEEKALLKFLTAFKKGDFSQRLPGDQTGITGKIYDTLNEIIEANARLTEELAKISIIVGKEGKTSYRANTTGMGGGWNGNIESINTLVTDLVQPTSEIARVIGAVAKGDLTQRMAVEIEGRTLTGGFLQTAKTVNTMVDQLNAFASEVTRVAREVGTDGKLGGQAVIKDVAGIWKDLTDNVNLMAGNLTLQVRNIADVTTAVANGNLAQKITVDAKGEILELKNTMNTMVDQLNAFASEVTRVAREVGTDGKLGGQAVVKDVAGIWKDLTDNVNLMAGNLTLQVRNIADVTTAVAKGNLAQKITVDAKGEILELKNTMNTMVDQLNAFASEVTRVAREVGTDGKLGGQAVVKEVAGIWKDLTDNVNLMAGNLTLQVRNIADVTTAVAKGNLAQKITVDAKGEILELKNTINIMVDQLNAFASEVTRVAREVGTDGKLGGQAVVKEVAGIWKDLTDNVNLMAGNLTLQVRNIADVTTAVAKGNLARKITVDAKGEILELKNTMNTMVDQLNAFASEVTRVAREVGTDGKLGGQAVVKDVAGIWKDLTDNVNLMAGNLTAQVRNIANVTTSVANGDLAQKITVDAKGEILELKNTINIMVDQLNAFASEVTRVAREVGTDGKLGGQAVVKEVAGIWKDLTDNVNLMAGNLTLQVRNIANVTTAVANGDLAQKITVDAKGEILELKNTINIMVDQLNAFASEVTRVAREVGTDGKLGGQAQVQGVAGVWKDLTDNVNLMAGNLTLQVRNIADVTTAVANGSLTRKITVEAKGEIQELKSTVNDMVDRLNSFASEVTRVAREVGTDGKLGGQSAVKDVAGIWKELTDNVNLMAGNLTLQVRNIADVTTAVANGNLSRKITVDAKGEILELKNTINTMVDQLNAFASEVTRVAREVGTDGKLGGQGYVQGVGGVWKDLTDNVNLMAGNLTLQVRNIADVTTAVAMGDLSKKITVDARGEILELKNTINTMVDQLNAFASEVTRVAKEVGTDGKLGGQSQVRGVSGIWKDLTDNVNIMAANLTDQVRGIAIVVTAVANGNLKKKLVLEAKGEIAALAETINGMIDTLALFADQVTGVAKEVGVDGILGGQANVPGAAGLWKELTDNVNQLAANLTTQVRAIAEVATAVTKGDLTRTIRVEARGEVEELKNNLNEMIKNLKETTQRNAEQDWLNSNLAKFTRMLQGQRELITVAKMLLSELTPLVNAQHGVFYIAENSQNNFRLKLLSTYGYKERKNISSIFKIGEGLVGQCAYEKQRILLNNVPSDYIQISSGLGEATPLCIIILPVLFEGQIKAVIEIASFERFGIIHQNFLDQLAESIGVVMNTIEANMRTEELLKQSQSLTEELQSQQKDLQQANEELEEKAHLLQGQKVEVERKNREVEIAKKEVEEKAQQLSVTSKYKSEFLSNMSHELRTPLNSLMILARQLSDNLEGNLTSKQVEFSKTIYNAATELLSLINDILDLSKIESGTVVLDIGEIFYSNLSDEMEHTFRQVAETKNIDFSITLDKALKKSIFTDMKRLQQILKNLLSNAFKFTEKGKIELKIENAFSGWSRDNEVLNKANAIIAFSVIDTGIGISYDKHKIIFEAFQQADGTTSRKYGGTGLGLAISREIAILLGGELRLIKSIENEGSIFTLYLPDHYEPKPIYPNMPKSLNDKGGNEFPNYTLNRLAPAINERVNTLSENYRNEFPDRDSQELIDDRRNLQSGDRIILIIEDDIRFVKILVDGAHEIGFKTVVATTGEESLMLAKKVKPLAITLDIGLPDMDGYVLLDRFKRDPLTCHIPIQVITINENRQKSLKFGAIGHIQKPTAKDEITKTFRQIQNFIDKKIKKLLVVDDDQVQLESIKTLIGNKEIAITAVQSGLEALDVLKRDKFDCMILDLRLPDIDGYEVIERIKKELKINDLPIIIYTGKDLTKEENSRLRNISDTIIIKGIMSPERLLYETTMFLHGVESEMPAEKQKMLENVRKKDVGLKDRKVLIVDDDVRNIFALASVLEKYGMVVISAEDGREGIEKLKTNIGVEIVLMDIMLPEMDGYEAIRVIRSMPEYKTLPVIALTAKAMKGDREKCIEAGASDYISKPVEMDKLISLMRVWLYDERTL